MFKVLRSSATLRKCVQFAGRSVAQQNHRAFSAFSKVYPPDDFSERHIGPSDAEKEALLEFLNLQVNRLSSR